MAAPLLTADEAYRLVKKKLERSEFDEQVDALVGKHPSFTRDAAAWFVISEMGAIKGKMTSISAIRTGFVNFTASVVNVYGAAAAAEGVCEDEEKADDDAHDIASSLLVEDATGRIRLKLWRPADMEAMASAEPGDEILIINGSVRQEDGDSRSKQVHLGSGSLIKMTEGAFGQGSGVATADIASLEEGAWCSVKGVITSDMPLKEFGRRDGTTGTIKRLTLFDGTGEIAAVFWDSDPMNECNVVIGEEIVVRDAVVKQDRYGGGIELHSTRSTKVTKGK